MTIEPAERAIAVAINVNRNDPAVARSAGSVCFADVYLGLTPQALC